jgi:hypoxanthine phosphoribosyltransferase
LSGSDGASGEIRVGWEEYYGLIEQLALKVYRSGYAFDALLCLARGGLRPGDVLSRIFSKPLGVLTVSSYRDDGGRRRSDLRIASAISALDAELAGRVLLVDDLADSGLTLGGVVNHLRQGYPRITELRTAVIWLKGCSEYRPDFFVRELPDSPWIHQPFERYDNLPPARLEQGQKNERERDDVPERCPKP